MTIGYKDSQSAIEQKEKRTTLTYIVGVCLLYFNLFEFSDWFFENTIS